MKQLEVTIMGQSYILGCPDGRETALLEAVGQVDREMCSIRDAGKVKARERIADDNRFPTLHPDDREAILGQIDSHMTRIQAHHDAVATRQAATFDRLVNQATSLASRGLGVSDALLNQVRQAGQGVRGKIPLGRRS